MRIALVNMPFARVDMPSIGLTQLRHALRAELGDRVEVDILYLNIDFARFVGARLFLELSVTATPDETAVADWFFRPTAFAEETDRSEEFYDRCFPDRHPEFRADLLRGIRQAPAVLGLLIDRYAIDRYDLVGLTSLFTQHVACFALARLLKARNPRLPVVMGGPNCEGPMGRAILRGVPAVDFVFSGPALKTLPAFVRLMLEGRPEQRDQPQGVLSRDKIARLGPAAPDETGEPTDINDVVPLDYEDFLAAFARLKLAGVKPMLSFETSRGCWWGQRHQCTFCGLNSTSLCYQAMKPATAVRYLRGLLDRYGTRIGSLSAVDNIMPRDYPAKVLPRLKVPPGVGIFYEVKSNLTAAEVRTLARASVSAVQVGIESLATSTLKLMNKGSTLIECLQVLKACAAYGVLPRWLLLVGFPGETEEVFRSYVELMPRLRHLPPPGRVYRLRFDRYSVYFDQPARFGLQLKPRPMYEMALPFRGQDLYDAAYSFCDESHDAWFARTVGPWWGQLVTLVSRWRADWSRQDKRERPQLALRREGRATVVYDSRAAEPVTHRLDRPSLRLLRLLEAPKLEESLRAALPALPAGQVSSLLVDLCGRGLVIKDGKKYLSLVLPGIRSRHAAEVEDRAEIRPRGLARRSRGGDTSGGRP
ncbi:MAG: RiPP maturation radical SAM protein 1 [Deltaproteobacteria bacterium]|nr:RiPP maturation radical SAM protein 1 [Deltaproteobacteria bacterium]